MWCWPLVSICTHMKKCTHIHMHINMHTHICSQECPHTWPHADPAYVYHIISKEDSAEGKMYLRWEWRLLHTLTLLHVSQWDTPDLLCLFIKKKNTWISGLLPVHFLFPKTHIWFPVATSSSSQLPITLFPGDPILLVSMDTEKNPNQNMNSMFTLGFHP